MNRKENEKKSIKMTYTLVLITFVSMVIINIVAYLITLKIKDYQGRLSVATTNIKLKAYSANILAKDIFMGNSRQKMTDVWQLLDEAREDLKVIQEFDQNHAIAKNLKLYREVLLEVYNPKNKLKKEYRELTLAQKKELSAKLQKKYNKVYTSLIQSIESIKSDINGKIIDKEFTFKLLYLALFLNMGGLCVFIIYNIRSYVKSSEAEERALAATRDKLNAILNSLTSSIISVSQDKTVVEWNHAAEEQFKVPEDEAIGQDVTELIPFLANYSSVIDKVFHSHKTETFYREPQEWKGARHYFDIAITYNASISGVVIRIDDTSQQELQDEQLRQAQKMEVVESMVAGLANDFNNVLGAIVNTLPVLRESIDNPYEEKEDIDDNIDLIEGATERAVVMVQEFLSLSQKHEITKEIIDVNSTVEHVMRICSHTLDKRIEIRLGAYQGDTTLIEGDPIELEQCLLNLCDNASQAMTTMRPKGELGGGILEVRVEHFLPDNKYRSMHPQATAQSYWCVSISDTGIGMPQEVIDKVFDPFFSTKGVGKGTGLGLTRVNDIITAHGGYITISSEVGKGTTFKVFLPEFIAKPGVDEHNLAIDSSERIPTGEGVILVVDDEKIMRKTAGKILKKLGYTAIFAENGLEAVEVYKEKHGEISAVLLDLMMPKMSGTDAYIEMKKIDPEIKALMISGFKKDERIQHALEVGVNGYIQKPYSLDVLAVTLKKLLAGEKIYSAIDPLTKV